MTRETRRRKRKEEDESMKEDGQGVDEDEGQLRVDGRRDPSGSAACFPVRSDFV